MSITNISTIEKPSLQELSDSGFECEVCGFQSKLRNEFMDHEGTHHKEENVINDKIVIISVNQNDKDEIANENDQSNIKDVEIKDDIQEPGEIRAQAKYDQVEKVTVVDTTCIKCGEDFPDNDGLNVHTSKVQGDQ